MYNKEQRKTYYQLNKTCILELQRNQYKKNGRKSRSKGIRKIPPISWKRYEVIGHSLLKGSVYLNQSYDQHKNHDLLWNNKTVDVKTVQQNKENCWVFPLNHVKDIDLFLLFCLKKKKIIKTLLIPTSAIPNLTGIGVGRNSKYDVYKIKQ